MATFENGKKYDFALNAKENGFAINRESGKLLFTITDPVTGHVYRVRPREFQKQRIPEILHCIYRNGFEQDSAAIYWDTSKNLCLAKDKAKAEQEELDIHDAA